MNDSLQETLEGLIDAGADSNPALNVLISDYTKYHVVLVVVGGIFLLGLILLSAFFWRHFKQATKPAAHRWTFEKTTYFGFGVLAVLVGLFMALVVAANVSNVLNPEQGFAGAVPMLATPKPGTQADELQQAFTLWLESDSPQVPPLVQNSIDDRLAWQRPKAIICSVLLAIFLVLSAGIWRALIRRSRAPEFTWRLRDGALLMLGLLTVGVCLLLMLMVMGNTQGSIAPISLTLFYG